MTVSQFAKMPSSAAYILPIVIKKKRSLLSPAETMNHIISIVCKYYDIPQYLIHGRDRKREIVVARQAAMYFIRLRTKYSLDRIGAFIGGRDHTTALYSVTNIKNLMSYDDEIRNDILNIQELLLFK